MPRYTEHAFSDAPGTQLLNFYLPSGFEVFLIGFSQPVERNELPPKDVPMPPPVFVGRPSRDYGQIRVLGLPGIDPPPPDRLVTRPTPGAIVQPYLATAQTSTRW